MVDSSAVLSVVLLLAFIGTAVINGLVTSGVGVSFTNAEIADSHPTYLLPAGYAFSIWGIIYLFMGVFCVYQALPSVRSQAEIVAVRPLALAAQVLNVAWLYLFSFEVFWVAFFVIAAYGAVLLRAVVVLDVDWISARMPLKTKLLVAAPFSLNASWVVVATCLQVGVNALEEGWLASADFCIGLLFLAVAVACYRCAVKADIAYGFVGAWALGGIISNQGDASTFGCASRICNTACVESMALCSAEGRFGALCSAYAATDADACTGVPKSSKVVTACWVYIALVLAALVAGVARGFVQRYDHGPSRAGRAGSKDEGLVLNAHALANGTAPAV